MVSKHSIHHIFGDHKVHVFRVDGTKGYFAPAKSDFLKNPDAPYVLFRRTSDSIGGEMYQYTFFSPKGKQYADVVGYPGSDLLGEKLQKIADDTGKHFNECS